MLAEPTPAPLDVPFADIAEALGTSGLLFEHRTLRRYHAALHARGFVILAGISGSGKTRLAHAYAAAAEAVSLICPVGPNWMGPEDLLGHTAIDGTFRATRFKEFLDLASAEWTVSKQEGRPARAYHLVLDEMNLARIEHYFAPFLSAMEMRSASPDGCAVIPLDGARTALLTPNLRFIGTVNIDETTHGFSDKVFDRAQLLEMEVPRELIQRRLGDADHAGTLLAIWDAINPVAPFAFRVVDDVAAYIAAAKSIGSTWQEALDEQIVQKILPKIRGGDSSLTASLTTLLGVCAGLPLSVARIKATQARLSDYGHISAS